MHIFKFGFFFPYWCVEIAYRTVATVAVPSVMLVRFTPEYVGQVQCESKISGITYHSYWGNKQLNKMTFSNRGHRDNCFLK